MSSENIYLNQISALSRPSKYLIWYTSIISNALSRATTKKSAKEKLGYFEGHHILPKSFKLGGDKDSMNIVYLTAREHLICHWVAIKMVINPSHKYSMMQAFHSMVFQNNGGKNKRVFIKHHALAREYASIANKNMPRESYGVPKSLRYKMSVEEFKSTLQAFCDNDVSMVKVGEHFNLTAACIHKWLKLYNISRRTQLRDKESLIKLLEQNSYSAYKVGPLLGVSGQAVTWYMRKFNITKP